MADPLARGTPAAGSDVVNRGTVQVAAVIIIAVIIIITTAIVGLYHR